jgi:bifunctional UDP-N-acetylglucosamine pyrophosphorylase/glucosamine-1-phosphate N-acetyltransferase
MTAKINIRLLLVTTAFIGSNSSLVAPVKIGNNTTIAAGSTITKDVPSDALGVGRAKQSNKDNWSKKKG